MKHAGKSRSGLFKDIKNPKQHVLIYRILIVVVMEVSVLVTFALPHSVQVYTKFIDRYI